eukprot:CAMPEP_0202457970 /NCGR_PEP_ID=MMETSP1360-20130828/18822_1 /ASSEMBLY_ACC=CAM_ASM_000848 /TAXON_ID=515479 /ORGANISM="Licmophora paradoxa, Strain CCMP2313" /LENGTH=240 /DNA_ID=CAMNT_0049078223 /DNA_START=27 /DNA_END=749 /DNA_ORIENTATION=+
MPKLDNTRSLPQHTLLMRNDSCSSAEIKKSNLVSEVKKRVAAANPSAAQNQQDKPKRHIRWNEDVTVKCIEHVNDMTDEEISDVWWTKEDFHYMKATFAITVRRIMNGVYLGDDDEHCSRGLEYRTRDGALCRRNNKLLGLLAVLEEQDRQVATCEYSDVRIACEYMKANKKCRKEALHMGLYDEEENQRLEQGLTSLTELFFRKNKKLTYCDESRISSRREKKNKQMKTMKRKIFGKKR